MSQRSVHDVTDWSRKFFDKVIADIEADKPLSVLRYGDGELTCMMHSKKGGGGVNYDGDLYSPILGNMIKDSIMNPTIADNFHYCLGEHCHQIGLIRDLTRDRIWNASIKFEDAFVFVHAGMDGRLQKLVDLLNQKHSIFVAPEYLQTLPIAFNERVISPKNNSFGKKDDIAKEIISKLSENETSVVVCALGMSAIPIILNLYRSNGSKHTFIDIGSVFDPYVEDGKYRSHFEKIKTKLNFKNDTGNKGRNRQASSKGAFNNDGGRKYNSHRKRKKASKRSVSEAL
jgi:hypothetical protein